MKSSVYFPCLYSAERLVKMSRDKTIRWQITFDAELNRPAMTEDAIYFVKDKQRTPSGLTKPAFCKVNMKDGNIIDETPLHSDLQVGIPHHKTSLRLTADTTMALWSGLNSKAHIFSTASGEVLYIFNQRSSKGVVLSSAENKFWSIDRDGVLSIGTCDKATNNFTLQTLSIRQCMFNEPWCIDGDRSMICSFIHETPMPYRQYSGTNSDLQATTLDPFTSVLQPGMNQSRITCFILSLRFVYEGHPPATPWQREGEATSGGRAALVGRGWRFLRYVRGLFGIPQSIQ